MSESSKSGWSSASTVLASAALALSTACTIAWLVGWVIPNETFVMRIVMLVSALVVSGGLLEILLRRLTQREREARRHLELLCRLEASGDAPGGVGDELPPIDPNSSWHSVLKDVRETLSSSSARANALEHSRAALEIRCRRSQAECQRVMSILDGLSEPVLAVDQYDELLLANPSARKLFGLPDDAMVGHPVSPHLHSPRLTGLLADARRRRVRTSRTEELELETPTGDRRWYSVTAANIETPAENGAPSEGSGVVAVLRDISAHRATQKQHAEFVSAASHEMKTPLAGIRAYVELLADGDAEDEDTREEFLGVIHGQAERLQRLIDNLLNLAHIEAGVVKVSKEPQALNELLLEAFNVVQPSAEAKQITLVQDLSPMYLGVFVDRDMMLQAAINLLSNAIKYTANGGRVTLRSRMLDGEVQFEVEDTGVGLSEEDCRKVFDKFYRVDANKAMAAGTGLGLPLAKHIVEDVHGGKLAVHSVLGKGSTFSITIPGTGKSST